MLEEIKKEFIEKHRFLVKKMKGRFGTVHYQLGHIVGDYYNQNNQNKIFDSEEEALNSIWQFIEQKLTEAIKQAKIEEQIKVEKIINNCIKKREELLFKPPSTALEESMNVVTGIEINIVEELKSRINELKGDK